MSVDISPTACRITVGISSTTDPQQVEVTELEGYSRPTCDKLCAFSNYTLIVVGVVNELDVDEFC